MVKICIVGNGQLTEEQQNSINKYDVVVRMNVAQSFRLGDKCDIIAIRMDHIAKIEKDKEKQKHFKKVYNNAQKVIFLNGSESHREEFLKNYGNKECLLYISYIKKYKPIHPSTGLGCIEYCLETYNKEDEKIDIYGFSFIGFQCHDWKKEKQILDTFIKQKKLNKFFHTKNNNHKHQSSPIGTNVRFISKNLRV